MKYSSGLFSSRLIGNKRSFVDFSLFLLAKVGSRLSTAIYLGNEILSSLYRKVFLFCDACSLNFFGEHLFQTIFQN